MVAGHQERGAAHAPDGHQALAVLDGLHGVSGLQDAGRLGDPAEGGVDEGQGLRLVDLARHHQDCVVRLVVLLVEGPEVVDIHMLDVAAGPDDGLPVVVPVIGRGHDPQDGGAEGAVLAGLELVADDGHLPALAVLAPQRLRREGAVQHPVRLQVQGLLQVLLGGGEGHIVVGAVEVGGAVGIAAQLVEDLPGVGPRLGALEEHVLQQVGHARLAVVLLPAAHQVGDVGGDGGLAGVGIEQHPQAVGQAVLGDALHGRDPDGGGQRQSLPRFRLGGLGGREGRPGSLCRHQGHGQGPAQGQRESTGEGHVTSRL